MQRLILPIFLLFPIGMYATVDYLAVNHITKELYWGDEDHSTGFMGWEVLPEGKYEELEEKYLGMGYSYTDMPYKIELGLAALIFVLALIFWFFDNFCKQE